MMRKIFVENGKARLLSFIKSPVFSHLGRGEWKVIASVDGKKRELETFTSVFNAQDSAVNVVDFPAFFCEFPADGRHEIKFFISIRGKEYPTNLLADRPPCSAVKYACMSETA